MNSKLETRSISKKAINHTAAQIMHNKIKKDISRTRSFAYNPFLDKNKKNK
ncbi:hypothetical protein [Apilactobacillus micheneri]|uniref:hypothetical protein n=1 Tax=Apilactobacillus micheneri TaxID=1899430 RepID=UPI000D523D5C|nr:hypothetical protein [Apilactobacillus micheneri]GAY79497.1 hypothetical protein NBRC113063_00332 [Apilactobacillus micheneri]